MQETNQLVEKETNTVISTEKEIDYDKDKFTSKQLQTKGNSFVVKYHFNKTKDEMTSEDHHQLLILMKTNNIMMDASDIIMNEDETSYNKMIIADGKFMISVAVKELFDPTDLDFGGIYRLFKKVDDNWEICHRCEIMCEWNETFKGWLIKKATNMPDKYDYVLIYPRPVMSYELCNP